MTGIEWTDKVWNPTTGCDQVSPGCGLPRWSGDEPHGTCYALTMARRLKGMGSAKYQNDGDPRTSGPGFGITEHPAALTVPLHWRDPQRVFVNSMSDLFHGQVSKEFIARTWAVMALTPQHTYQVLTKRPAIMRSLLGSERWPGLVRDALTWVMENVTARMPAERVDAAVRWAESPEYPDETLTPLPNVWLGVSVEDQKRADLRVPALLDTPAAVRFVSAEPLLGPVDFGWCDGVSAIRPDWCGGPHPAPGTGAHHPLLDWVIVGGESGPGARPLDPEWVRAIRDECDADVSGGTAFFFKQWGGPTPKVGGRDLDGRTWDQYPQAVTR